ncbi:MAG: hypothetical protein IIT98_02340 [Kiritimatiellae bacterium]|nr:hypothetical protein [Kiritimatiellia bacterium]
MRNYRLNANCRHSAPGGNAFSTVLHMHNRNGQKRRRGPGSAGMQKRPWHYLQFLGYNLGFSNHYHATKLYGAGSPSKTFTIIWENVLERLVK